MQAMSLHLLGHPSVYVAGRKITFPTRKLLGLVSYLALEGPTSRSKLADLFWTDLNASAARGNLRRELNRWRHTEVGDLLHTEPDSVSLNALDIDVTTFRGFARKGQCREALALYRGPLLEGLDLPGALGFQSWLEIQQGELVKAYCATLTAHATELEAVGRPREALEAHIMVLREDELQEFHHREVMRLHAVLGERAAALSHYGRFKELLGRELHLEPLPATQRLADELRRPSTRPSSPIKATEPSTSPPLTFPLIGREVEWEEMERAWAAGQVIYISGEPGIGKSRLLFDFAASKGLYLTNLGQRDDQGIPYASAARVVRQELARPISFPLSDTMRTEFSRTVPELGLNPPPIRTSEERLHFINVHADFLFKITQECPTLVTDDLHFYDDPSFELTSACLPRVRFSNPDVHILVAYRSSEVSTAKQRQIDQFVASGLAVEIKLKPLSEEALLNMVGMLPGHHIALFSRQLHQSTGGNPLFVLETLRAMRESDELQADSQGRGRFDDQSREVQSLPLPGTVRQVIEQRLQHFEAAPRRLLEAASLTGDDFRLSEIEGATALSDWEAIEALEALLTAGLWSQQGDAYRFSHDLVRRAVAAGLSTERRRMIHLKLAARLERLEAAPARIARHLEQGGQAQAAVSWRVRAAQEALRMYAHSDALTEYELALRAHPGADMVAFIQAEQRRLKVLMQAAVPSALS